MSYRVAPHLRIQFDTCSGNFKVISKMGNKAELDNETEKKNDNWAARDWDKVGDYGRSIALQQQEHRIVKGNFDRPTDGPSSRSTSREVTLPVRLEKADLGRLQETRED